MAQINYGTIGEIKVHDTPTHAVVEVPRFEQLVSAQLKGKVQGRFYDEFVHPEGIVAKDKFVLLGVDKNFLRTESQIRDFNHRVSKAAAIHKKIDEDLANIDQVVKFDMGGTKPVFSRFGQDEKTAQGEHGTVKTKKDWAYGTVAALNDSYVAFDAGQNEKFQYVRILPLEKFVQTPEQKAAYEDYLQAKIANPDAKLDNPFKERFPVGQYKKLSWKKEGKNTVISEENSERVLSAKKEVAEEKQEPKEENSKVAKVAQAVVEQEVVATVAKKKAKKKEASLSM